MIKSESMFNTVIIRFMAKTVKFIETKVITIRNLSFMQCKYT